MHYIHLICALLLASAIDICLGNSIDPYYISTDAETTERNHNSVLCQHLKPQHSIDIQKIMNVWYGNEIIMHTQDVPGVYEYDSCVIIHFSDITDQMQMTARDYNYNNYRYTSAMPQQQHQRQQQDNHQPTQDEQSEMKYLRMIWAEGDNNLEYTFNYTQYNPGLWTNMAEQRGSFLNLNQYTQFKGVVQVVKAVNDHLVLTFCGTDLRSSIYTIVLSRNKNGLTEEKLRGIRSLLGRRGLSTESIRKVCSAAPELKIAMPLILAVVVLTIWKRFS